MDSPRLMFARHQEVLADLRLNLLAFALTGLKNSLYVVILALNGYTNSLVVFCMATGVASGTGSRGLPKHTLSANSPRFLKTMPIQLGRPLLSYAKVQAFLGVIVPNRSAQVLRKRVRSLAYLDFGCGWNVHEHMLNCVFRWHPKVDLCWDIAGKLLPFRNARFTGVYSEHCFEHHSPDVVERILRECFRLLAPGGVLRLFLPDVERYLRSYIDILVEDKQAPYPYPEDICWCALSSPLLCVNRIFCQDRESPHGHCFMFDDHLLHVFLKQAGFVEIGRKGFRLGRDFALLLDSESRWVESFAMTAVRP